MLNEISAFVDRLQNTPAVFALVGDRIYTHTPPKTEYPYITLSVEREASNDTDTSIGQLTSLTLHVWSRAKSIKESSQILEAARDALHRRPLAITGTNHVDTLQERSSVFRDDDLESFHGFSTYRITSEKEIKDGTFR